MELYPRLPIIEQAERERLAHLEKLMRAAQPVPWGKLLYAPLIGIAYSFATFLITDSLWFRLGIPASAIIIAAICFHRTGQEWHKTSTDAVRCYYNYYDKLLKKYIYDR